MAKGILEFNTEEPYERNAFKRATHATDAYLCLWDIREDMLRQRHKYGDSMGLTAVEQLLVESMYSEFFGILENHGVDLNDLD